MSSRCPGCSAAVRPGDRWCGLCLRVLTAADPGPDAGAMPVPGPPGEAQPASGTARAGPEPARRVPLPLPRTSEQVVRAPGGRPPSVHWPCPGCGAEVPVALDRCPGCSTAFLAPLRGGSATGGLAATLQQQSRAKRLLLGVLAGGLVSLLLVGVLALLALLL